MNKCILVTSHLNNDKKIDSAKSLLTYLSDKGMPIILIGNHKIPYEFQSMCSWVIYGDENPHFNRYYIPQSSIWLNRYGKTLKLNVKVIDHGFAHLLLMYRGFRFAHTLGFDYVYHLNYDIEFLEDGWGILNNMIGYNNNVVKSWQDEHLGYETNLFCFNLNELIPCFDEYLSSYPMNQQTCEVYFKSMITNRKIKHDVFTDNIYNSNCSASNHRLYIDNIEFEAFRYDEEGVIILMFNKPHNINSFHDINGVDYELEKTEKENVYIIKLIRDIQYLYDNKYVFSYDDLENCYVEV
jgi:hypothetical protein